MNLARELAGFSMGEADTLRSAMGKKKEAEMLELQPKFIEGCVQNGVRKSVALEIYEDMRKFARYAFNRAHTVGVCDCRLSNRVPKALLSSGIFGSISQLRE